MRFRAIAVLGLIFYCSFVPALKAEKPAIIGEWIAAQQRMGDLNVSFKLTRTLPSLKAPIVSDGHFWRMADGRFRWELGKPAATILVHDGKDLNLWDADRQKWQALSPDDGRMRMWMHFLNTREMTADTMTKDFIATVTGSDDKVVTVALQPKGLMVRRHLKQVDLQIDPASYYLRQIRLIQSDGSTVMMSFGSPQSFTESEKRRISFKPDL